MHKNFTKLYLEYKTTYKLSTTCTIHLYVSYPTTTTTTTHNTIDNNNNNNNNGIIVG